MLAVLMAAAITLIAAAVIGGRQAESSTSALASEPDQGEVSGPSSEGPGYESTLSNAPKVGPQSTANTGGPATGPSRPGGAAAVPGGLTKSGERKSVVGATREGVHKDHFEVGFHGPITFDGAPLPLAEDPITGIKGYVTWVNRNGGVNGLKVRAFIDDDRYTTAGGRATADRLAKEVKPFFIEGTLGIDQIHKVALGARAAGIPYFAGGGPEPEMKGLMYQAYANYDDDMRLLAQWICKYGKQYVGENEIRIGTTTLNSELIIPVEKRFISLLQQRKCVGSVDSRARGTVQKPTEQVSYTGQLAQLRQAYNNRGANLIVALQDPITTSRQVGENRSFKSPTYNPKWTFSNFAHDSDTALSLMGGDWTGVRGLSPACYYHPSGGGTPYNAARCAKMAVAHQRWNSLGSVQYDQNAGGGAGGKSSYNYNEESWTADGSGGSYGYQIIFFWHGAMKSIGADPTREKFLAALNAYSNYSDLVTGPITFRGIPNKMIGAKKFVVLEGKSNLKFRQMTEVTPGLVDHF